MKLEGRDPVAVFIGEHTACIQLQLTLEGHGIRTDLETLFAGDYGVGGRVYVSRADLQRAAPLVEDFKRGWKAPP